MRTVKITCNRCGKEITGYPVSLVPVYTERNSQTVLSQDKKEKNGIPEEAPQQRAQGTKDYCEDCTVKILAFANGMVINEKFEKNFIKSNEKPPVSEDKNSNKKPTKKLDMGKILALKDAGWTNKQIGEEFGTTANVIAVTISKHKKKNDKE